MKDMFGLSVFLVIYAIIVFYVPDYLGDPVNYVKANPLVTPVPIEPEWYFLAVLRDPQWSVPNKLLGVILMFGAVAMLFLLPWLDTSKVRSAKFRPTYQWIFWFFALDCLLLGLVGSQEPAGIWIILGRVGTLGYFRVFLWDCRYLRLVRNHTAAARQHQRTRYWGAAACPARQSPPSRWRRRDAEFACIPYRWRLRGWRSCPCRHSRREIEPQPSQDWSFYGAFGTFDWAGRAGNAGSRSTRKSVPPAIR